MIGSAEIREKFLRFFQGRQHTIVKSSSLVPANDPTLLFANAGMVQFKDLFLGLEKRPYSRATSSQKCMRVSGKHNDLDSVGPSPRHHTFFEMLGNFSFGDYFKAEAIDSAWAFLTQELGLDPNRLYPTVYEEDDEALELWQKIADLPARRIARLGKKDNFWEMGDTGPCGPCSEIIYDRGPDACTCGNPNCNLAIECDRWLELWNLVFMQFEKHDDGTMTPLPQPSIDTGLGLERITSVLQDVDNNYDTDLFLPVMRRVQELLGHDAATMRANSTPYRVIADHSRAITFLVADGILPGNEGRNYVARLILRRAARFGRLLGFDDPFLAETAQSVIETMGHHYTELKERREFICQVITQEEERFLTTLATGLSRLDQLASRLAKENANVIPGEDAFRLYDTYGFPLELTCDAAEEMGLTVDQEGFRIAMAKQRERARSAQRFAIDAEGGLYRRLDLPKTDFVGYESCVAESHILALVRDGQSVDRAREGQDVDIVLDTTPFYAKAGGQVGDTGELRSAQAHLLVGKTVRPVSDMTVHHAKVFRGHIVKGDTLTASVDEERRLDIARNHTATHLLHRALRQVLGEHATQSGSLVAPDRLRFDFAHLSPLSEEELHRVEDIVNAQIRANLIVTTRETSYDEAIKEGATALFGEKYGDRVRVVTVRGFTVELCGGTHLTSTGQIGSFLIAGESSIGSGLRRIEALTGRGAQAYTRERLTTLDTLANTLSARSGEETRRATALVEQLREQRRTIQDLERQVASRSVDSLLDKTVKIKGVQVLTARVQAGDADALREMCDRFRDKLGSAVVALGAIINDRPTLVVALTQDLVTKGLHAGKLAGTAARRMGGGGGGRPNLAQAGGKDVSRLADALAAVPELIAESLI